MDAAHETPPQEQHKTLLLALLPEDHGTVGNITLLAQLQASAQAAGLKPFGEEDFKAARDALVTDGQAVKGTFGITPSEHSQLKKLDQVKTGNNLRDHMTDLELIFTMLGEASTTEIARRSDAVGFVQNRTSAKQGGTIAGNARKALEVKTGKAVVSKANYLAAPATPDLLEDTAPTQPGKPKARTRAKPPKGALT